MRKLILAIVILLSFILSGPVFSESGQLTREERGWLAGGSRSEKEGWIFLHLQGAPYERGFQYGYLLAREIEKAVGMQKHLIYWDTPKDFAFFVETGKRLFSGNLDAEIEAELDGMAAGLERAGVEGIGTDELVAHNAFIELVHYWWPWAKEKPDERVPVIKPPGCSAFIATGSSTAGGSIVLAHNTWCNYAWGSPANVVIDLQPAGGHRILMQTLAGYVHSGMDFFVCSSGLVGAETTIGDYTGGFDTTGTAEFCRVRRAMQYAGSIDEWASIMIEKNNGGYANSWLIGDVRTGEIARLELGNKYHKLEKKTDGCFLGSNIAVDRDVLLNETETNFSDIRKSNVARRVSWKRLMKMYGGRIDAALARRMLADHYDAWLRRDNPGPRSICGHVESTDGITSPYTGVPFRPAGAVDGKVVDSHLARNMSFWARWGSSCGAPFYAEPFLDQHPQFEWLRGYMDDRPTRNWVIMEIK